MRSSNTKGQPARRSQSQSRPGRRSPLAFLSLSSRMPNAFSILRFCVYGAVLAWTVICLAIAAHFQSLLVSSDLTHFVPFALFVCSATFLIILALLGFGFLGERNPISTRIELACLTLAGVLWLALSAFVASSDAEDAEVECYSSTDSSELVAVSGFNTEVYQAQYRVLEAFSFFNLILILSFSVFLLVLALLHRRRGQRYVWLASVTTFPWFGQGGKQNGGKLPAPVTQRARSQSRSRPGLSEKRTDTSRTRTSTRPRRESWRIVDFVRPSSWRGDNTTRPSRSQTTRALPNRQDSQRTLVGVQDYQGKDPKRSESQRREPYRQDSQRTAVSRQDSQRRDPYRQDSQRRDVLRQDSQRRDVYRQDSQRSQINRQDSQRAQPIRQDSQRTQPTRQDSQRTQVNRQDSSRTQPHRQDSSRSQSQTRVARSNSQQRGQPQRQDSSSRRLQQIAADGPTRNESPTYVYWLPHKAPDPAHVRDTRPRDNYRRDASPRR